MWPRHPGCLLPTRSAGLGWGRSGPGSSSTSARLRQPTFVPARLAGVADLLRTAGSLPVPVVAALAHAEIAVTRPFVRGNGLVARALERTVVAGAGLDPTGVAVPEAGYLAAGGTAYLGALAAYASGTPAGVALWLRHAGAALVTGAQEGERICDAVLAGRLSAIVTGVERS